MLCGAGRVVVVSVGMACNPRILGIWASALGVVMGCQVPGLCCQLVAINVHGVI